jgi:ADP-ribose pyrophosphatase
VERWPSGEREIVHHPGACAVIGLTGDDEVVLIRQVREAVRGVMTEIPAGILDVGGEDAAACASRELLEETGFRAENIRSLGSIHTTPGFSDERIELFAADAVPQGSSEDGIGVALLPLDEALRAVLDGSITDAKTMVALFRVAAERAT